MESVEATGQVVHVRRLSRKLAFIDFASTGASVAALPSGFELCCRPCEGEWSGVEDDVALTVKRLKLGDIVRVRGVLQQGDAHDELPTLLWQALPEVIERWADRPGSATFAPRPTAKRRRSTPASRGSGTVDAATMCKYWINTGNCPKGDACSFRHIDMQTKAGKRARTAWVAKRKAARLARQAAASATTGDALAPAAKRHKNARADVFCEWLVGALGSEALACGSGVLDIAGGRGDVSFELAVKHNLGARCTLVDPRPRKLKKAQRRALAKAGLGAEVLGVQQRALFDDAWCVANATLLAEASVIVGMHSDEATEAIVATAVRHRKPFAVVPCCVFPSSGERLAYDQWLDYLQRIHPAIQRTFLAFQGKNCVLWCFDYDRGAAVAARGGNVTAEGGGAEAV